MAENEKRDRPDGPKGPPQGADTVLELLQSLGPMPTLDEAMARLGVLPEGLAEADDDAHTPARSTGKRSPR
ncbi:hypothetical protein [Streptomyces mobaraensis]|uniref:Uncharacterized protein n=1 Tax=Streptomyces mobaraensis TaxID=35621 RepID=A0A5N5W176_STRMB|nr:hypothetical protein [Streptomyces mobaraensis]KAB7835549.1 hypothetical protein FRZ00_27050 [Streptomyces mobaraensis]